MNSMRAGFAGAAAGIFLCVAVMGQETPRATLNSFKLAPGLQASVWASEPGMVNPTDMDIDERGRIWVTEGADYRTFETRPKGDRILILEDTHHSGVCDSYKVFVQDKRLQSPLGICKLGNKLYVAQSPNVLVYTIDASGDHPVGQPTVLFTGFEGVNHDHGVHAGVFGPDGRFYFNCGNEGGKGLIKYGDGRPVIDVTGSEVGDKAVIYRGKPKPPGFLGPRQGLALSCNPDGSDFEIMGYNFRNNYELCVDSFGTVWQSDNDDDGNQGCAINYVMEGGNFGYTGPEGSNWGRDEQMYPIPGRTHQEAQWHQRWPGIVPNMLHTGMGAPCGILFYEGDLLPKRYHGALIHAEAGQNVVRAYLLQPSEHVARGIMNKDGDESEFEKVGAGYKADPVELVKGRDHWFRPDDVCAAPDGAVYVTDWYDPGVGGHNMQDTGARTHDWHKLHGRIYRIAPQGYAPAWPALDLSTVKGRIAALESPNLSRRYLGYTKLLAGLVNPDSGRGQTAQDALNEVFEKSTNPYFRARALWLLARGPRGQQAVQAALKDADPNIRVTGVRAARRIKMDMVGVANELLADPSPAVLRELCLAMRFEPDDRAIPVLVKLADKYDGTDRWYLEALGIGATDREMPLLQAWRADHQNRNPRAEKGIIWRLEMQPPVAPVKVADAPRHRHRKAKSTVSITRDFGSDSHALLVSKDGKPLPPIEELASMAGDRQAGEKVFRNAAGANCIRCHQIGKEGGAVGPPLTAIGQKLTKPQLYDAILHPSAAILMGYETWVVQTRSGDVLSGRKTEDTADHVTLLDADGKYHDVPASQVRRKVKQNVSLMPEGVCQALTRRELVDLVEFLASCRGQ